MKTKFIILFKLLAFCLLLVSSRTAYGQVVIGGNYRFISNIPNTLNTTNNLTLPSVDIQKGNIINVIDIDYANKKVFYKYWNFKDAANQQKFNGTSNNMIFEATFDVFEKLTEPIYKQFKGFSAGAYTVPFKIRGVMGGGDFDFESSLSLQANVVAGFGRKTKQNSWFDASVGLGLTGIELNELNSNLTEGQRSATAFTVSLGAVLKFNQTVNAGIFLGKDWLSAKDSAVDWEYHGKMWLGLGINVSFTEAKSKDNTADPGDQ